EIPLDYSVNVDKKVAHYLSYGHINVYTPSLFKFLLKSEGYEILAERLTQTTNEVTRYNMYNNMKLEKSFLREVKLTMGPVINFLRKIKLGQEKYNEFAFSAYTCLAKGAGELKIF
ncbi:MAG: hypothetical protein HY221_02750, partial [Candidatus Sungbacteria bacterium]|nr:hypothetical protein [Candidatus Sungbacteria bacterium]